MFLENLMEKFHESMLKAALQGLLAGQAGRKPILDDEIPKLVKTAYLIAEEAVKQRQRPEDPGIILSDDPPLPVDPGEILYEQPPR